MHQFPRGSTAHPDQQRMKRCVWFRTKGAVLFGAFIGLSNTNSGLGHSLSLFRTHGSTKPVPCGHQPRLTASRNRPPLCRRILLVCLLRLCTQRAVFLRNPFKTRKHIIPAHIHTYHLLSLCKSASYPLTPSCPPTPPPRARVLSTGPVDTRK